MSRRAKLWFAAPVVLGFFAFACFGTQVEQTSPGRSTTGAPAPVATNTPPPADQTQRLPERATTLEGERRTARGATEMVDVGPQVVELNAESPPSAAPAALQAHYDAVFSSETLDRSWAPAEESAFLVFFSTDSAKGARLEKAECRESMCRIRVQFDDASARSRFLTSIGAPPFNHGGFYRTDEGTGEFTLYTAREGRMLPSMDPQPS